MIQFLSSQSSYFFSQARLCQTFILSVHFNFFYFIAKVTSSISSSYSLNLADIFSSYISSSLYYFQYMIRLGSISRGRKRFFSQVSLKIDFAIGFASMTLEGVKDAIAGFAFDILGKKGISLPFDVLMQGDLALFFSCIDYILLQQYHLKIREFLILTSLGFVHLLVPSKQYEPTFLLQVMFASTNCHILWTAAQYCLQAKKRTMAYLFCFYDGLNWFSHEEKTLLPINQHHAILEHFPT